MAPSQPASTHSSSSFAILPRVTAFPILPEGHLLYKVTDALNFPAKERRGSPLIGQQAPEIILRDQLDRDCSLHATVALGRPIVLYFFPLAGSPHCTRQGCDFRDALVASPTFTEQDAIVIGVSQDSPEMLKKFTNKHDLNFIVLSDEKREAFDTYGVTTKFLGLVNSRCTFIIDPSGVIRGMCEGVLAARGHMDFAERWLRRIEDEMWHKSNGFSSQAMVSSISAGESSPKLPTKKSKWPGLDGDALHATDVAGNQTNGSSSADGNHGASARDQIFRRGPLEVGQQDLSSGSLSQSNSTKSSTKRSLRKAFFRSREAPAPLPPTYENFDSGIRDFGEIEGITLANGGAGQPHDLPLQTNGGELLSHWPPRPTTSSQSSGGFSASNPSSPTSLENGGHGLLSRNDSASSNYADGAARKHAGSTITVEDATFVPIPSAKATPSATSKNVATSRLASAVKTGSNGLIGGSPSRTISQQARPVAKPPNLEEVEEDRETEAVVRRIAEGSIDLTPKTALRPLPPSSTAPSIAFTMAGPAPQAPKRTTSRVQPPSSVLNGTNIIRPSSKNTLDLAVEAARHQAKLSTSPIPSSSFDATRASTGTSEGSLAPRPPTMRTAPVRFQPQESTKRHVVTPGGQDDEDDDEDQAAVRRGVDGQRTKDEETRKSDWQKGQAAPRSPFRSQPASPYKNDSFAAVRRSHSVSSKGQGRVSTDGLADHAQESHYVSPSPASSDTDRGRGDSVADTRSMSSTPTKGSNTSQGLTPTGSILGAGSGQDHDPESEVGASEPEVVGLSSSASSPSSSSGVITGLESGGRGQSQYSGAGASVQDRSSDRLSISSSLASDLHYREGRRPSGASGASLNSSLSRESAGTFGDAS